MGKEAKFGLAIVVVLLIGVGGVVAWKKFSKPSPILASAQANAEKKEKTANAAEPKAEKPNMGLPPFQWPPSQAGKDGPKKVGERGSWNKTPAYREPKPSAEKATAISPPPTIPMPDAPTPENANPNNPYDIYQSPLAAPTTDPMGPPGEAAVAAAEDGHPHGKKPRNRPGSRFQEQNVLPLDPTVPSEMNQLAPMPPGHGGNTHPNALRQEPSFQQPIADGRYAPKALNGRPPLNGRDNPQGGNVPYHQRPKTSLTASDNHWPRQNPYGRSNEPDYTSNSRFQGDGTYDVQPNDNFWEISKKVYENGAYFAALEELNRDKLVDGRLKVGATILTPDIAELEKKFPGKCPKANHREVQQNRDVTLVSARNLSGTLSYTVVEGDTLFDIARYELGKASRWAEIYELNRDVLGKDFDYLVPGTELALPEDNPQRPDPSAQRPSRYSRR